MFFLFYKNFSTTMKIYFFILAAGLFFIIIKDITSDSPQKTIGDSLVIGLSTESIPQGYIKENMVVGFIAEYCMELGKQLNKKTVLCGIGWGEFVPKLQSGEILLALVPHNNPIQILNEDIAKMPHVNVNEKYEIIVSPTKPDLEKSVLGVVKNIQENKIADKIKNGQP
ncbi:hypothetical protein HN446_03595 [bacterium]|jgi:ABC-type amino acid transport substrate-binding protein|nr:hypothetical protein [bacterium]